VHDLRGKRFASTMGVWRVVAGGCRRALRYGWAPAISEHFAAVYAALASVAAARLPSFA
jgi:hypothetical protein